jgi:hypothetical protein
LGARTRVFVLRRIACPSESALRAIRRRAAAGEEGWRAYLFVADGSLFSQKQFAVLADQIRCSIFAVRCFLLSAQKLRRGTMTHCALLLKRRRPPDGSCARASEGGAARNLSATFLRTIFLRIIASSGINQERAISLAGKNGFRAEGVIFQLEYVYLSIATAEFLLLQVIGAHSRARKGSVKKGLIQAGRVAWLD